MYFSCITQTQRGTKVTRLRLRYILFIFGGVGGIEAEAVMLGQAISMVVPKVVGYKITGQVNAIATSTDVVLTITKVSEDIKYAFFPRILQRRNLIASQYIKCVYCVIVFIYKCILFTTDLYVT